MTCTRITALFQPARLWTWDRWLHPSCSPGQSPSWRDRQCCRHHRPDRRARSQPGSHHRSLRRMKEQKWNLINLLKHQRKREKKRQKETRILFSSNKLFLSLSYISIITSWIRVGSVQTRVLVRPPRRSGSVGRLLLLLVLAGSSSIGNWATRASRRVTWRKQWVSAAASGSWWPGGRGSPEKKSKKIKMRNIFQVENNTRVWTLTKK